MGTQGRRGVLPPEVPADATFQEPEHNLNGLYKCRFCDMVSPRAANVKRHQQRHAEPQFGCRYHCGFWAYRPDQPLKRHELNCNKEIAAIARERAARSGDTSRRKAAPIKLPTGHRHGRRAQHHQPLQLGPIPYCPGGAEMYPSNSGLSLTYDHPSLTPPDSQSELDFPVYGFSGTNCNSGLGLTQESFLLTPPNSQPQSNLLQTDLAEPDPEPGGDWLTFRTNPPGNDMSLYGHNEVAISPSNTGAFKYPDPPSGPMMASSGQNLGTCEIHPYAAGMILPDDVALPLADAYASDCPHTFHGPVMASASAPAPAPPVIESAPFPAAACSTPLGNGVPSSWEVSDPFDMVPPLDNFLVPSPNTTDFPKDTCSHVDAGSPSEHQTVPGFDVVKARSWNLLVQGWQPMLPDPATAITALPEPAVPAPGSLELAAREQGWP